MLTAINDLHLGAVRSAGTTQATALALRQYLLHNFRRLLSEIDSDLLINGDLFDSANAPLADVLEAYSCLATWLERTGKCLFLSDGNHDLSKNSTQLSSFQLLAKLLLLRFPEQAAHVTGEGRAILFKECVAYESPLKVYVIPHVANQDLFNVELSKVPEDTDYLFVHANYNNFFAVEADHSLNMSEDQAKSLKVRHIVFGHEHQQRTALNGKVVIVGNQIPSSVADCLGNAQKCLLQAGDDYFGGYSYTTTWEAEGDYSEQDWKSLEDIGRFIRISGTATAEEASTVISVIAKFRQTAEALVITNAVKIEGQNDTENLALSHDEITTFNVLGALLELLTPEEGTKINNLLAQHSEGMKND